MRVRIDPARCQGHGQCAIAVPDVFALGGDPKELRSRVMVETVPAGLESAVREAALICPEIAVVVIEPDGADTD